MYRIPIDVMAGTSPFAAAFRYHSAAARESRSLWESVFSVPSRDPAPPCSR